MSSIEATWKTTVAAMSEIDESMVERMFKLVSSPAKRGILMHIQV